jgi:hypothetical protein
VRIRTANHLSGCLKPAGIFSILSVHVDVMMD